MGVSSYIGPNYWVWSSTLKLERMIKLSSSNLTLIIKVTTENSDWEIHSSENILAGSQVGSSEFKTEKLGIRTSQDGGILVTNVPYCLDAGFGLNFDLRELMLMPESYKSKKLRFLLEKANCNLKFQSM
jgi:hypothetical protein